MTTWRRKRFSLQVSCGDNISGMWLFKVTKHRWLNPRAGKVKWILCCDWLLERARWAPLGSRKKTFSFWQYNKSFVDLVWSQDGWLLAFFGVFVGLGAVSVYKIRSKSPGQYSAILNSRLVNNAYIYIKNSGKNFSLCVFLRIQPGRKRSIHAIFNFFSCR